MATTRARKVSWKQESDAHDYPAAASYLSLLFDDPDLIGRIVEALPKCEPNKYKAKDLLRAADLPLLPATNPHVASDLKKIRKGRSLSQVLLVRGDLLRGFPLQIADGYHRVCASYLTDENTEIPCRIVTIPTTQIRTPRSSPASSGTRPRATPRGR